MGNVRAFLVVGRTDRVPNAWRVMWSVECGYEGMDENFVQ